MPLGETGATLPGCPRDTRRAAELLSHSLPMGAATALPVSDLRVVPGETTTAKMLVRNTGSVVDQYTIDVVGASTEWAKVEPKTVNLLPGADVEVTITFAPAKSPQVAAGVVPFGIRVLSREDPPGSAVAEGTIDVAAFSDVQIELVPRQSTGRRKGKHQVAIDNNSNQPTTVQVTATDEQEELDFRLDHSVASIEPGAAAFIRLRAVPDKRFLKGADRQHPFVVTVVPNNAEPIATRGTMTQKQLLPAWLIPALAILAILAIAAIVLYETLLKPQIKSEAKDAAAKAASSQASSLASAASSAQAAAGAASSAAEQAQSQASEANKAASSAESILKNGGGPNAGPTGANGANLNGGTATAFSIQTAANPDHTFHTFLPGDPIKPNQILVVTYMILQNPNGDAGTLEIRKGNDTLLTEGLANFRDLDHPFQVEPLQFTAAQPLQVAVSCDQPGNSATQCTPSVLITGRLVDKPAP
ncbi:MAG: hypothetical protein QOH89_250 [Pseudonocardiales bacterium]|nr:hypothetical protein [Pseudonocardiales bacterium]